MATVQPGAIVRYLRYVMGHEALRHLTDHDLIDRFVAERDEAAFATLVRRYGALVLGVCRRVLRHEQDAEDGFQATFILLAHKASLLGKGQSVASWLYGVAYRMAMNAKRKAARRRAFERRAGVVTPLIDPLTTPTSGALPPPLAQVSLRELQTILDDEVNRLSEPQRAVFVLCCLEGKSRSEAAKELGWKEGTVATRLAQARASLQ